MASRARFARWSTECVRDESSGLVSQSLLIGDNSSQVFQGVVAVDRADWQREIHRRVTRVDASQSLEHVEEVDADVGVEYVPDCPIHV